MTVTKLRYTLVTKLNDNKLLFSLFAIFCLFWFSEVEALPVCSLKYYTYELHKHRYILIQSFKHRVRKNIYKSSFAVFIYRDTYELHKHRYILIQYFKHSNEKKHI